MAQDKNKIDLRFRQLPQTFPYESAANTFTLGIRQDCKRRKNHGGQCIFISGYSNPGKKDMANRPIIIHGKQGKLWLGAIVIQQIVDEIRFLVMSKRFSFYSQDIV